ncbi:hypothetical protein Taro_001255 [Colocasia esculenta]|uniref:Uncharacterized protein n=1 Tax=Colocasia esculenta TaxID=4460 RepID=A0A843TAH8_COLES|nr:hypothetical protein [Colocasia esculenta]
MGEKGAGGETPANRDFAWRRVNLKDWGVSDRGGSGESGRIESNPLLDLEILDPNAEETSPEDSSRLPISRSYDYWFTG